MDELLPNVKKIMKQKQLTDLKVIFDGTSGKTDGYLGVINFITIIGKTEDKETKKLHLVVKSVSKTGSEEELGNINSLFRQESLLYENILPAFKKFQIEKGVKELFESYPKCYGTDFTNRNSVIIVENLKKIGYQLHDRKIPLDFNHLKLVMTDLGKFHALSFAMRDQRRQEFEKLIENLTNIQLKQLEETLVEYNKYLYKSVLKLFEDRNEIALHEKYSKLVNDNINAQVGKLMKEDTGYSVIGHGDFWNNNVMFHYEDSSRTPSKLGILDFQMSSVANTPVYDIIQFLYTNHSIEHLKNWKQFLTIYYVSFSGCLTELGCDPNKLYSYATLEQHWKKFQLFALALLPIAIKLMYVQEDELFDMENTTFDDPNIIADKLIIKDEEYYETIITLHKFYFEQEH